MKTRTIFTTLTACLTVVLFAGSNVHAVELPNNPGGNTTTPNTTTPTIAAGETCTRITTLYANDGPGVTTRVETMRTAFSKQLEDVLARKKANADKVIPLREAAREKFETKIAELKKLSGLTAEQLTAIDDYQDDVQAAEDVRAKAVDSARDAYAADLAGTITEFQLKLTSAAAAYKTAIAAAFATAQSQCGSGTPLVALKAAIKSARDTFQASVGKTGDTKTEVKTLAETRRKAVEDANTVFKGKVKEYTQTLKLALTNVKSSASSSSKESSETKSGATSGAPDAMTGAASAAKR